MYHFGVNIHFKTENVLCLNIIFLPFYKIILIAVIFFYLLSIYLFFVSPAYLFTYLILCP